MTNKIIKNKTVRSFLLLFILIVVLLLPYFVFATDNPAIGGLKKVQLANSGFAEADEWTISTILGTIIRGFLSLLGMIFTVLMIYGGYNWMIAGGREDKVSKAQDTIRRAIIGLVVTLASYAIWNYIWFSFIATD